MDDRRATVRQPKAWHLKQIRCRVIKMHHGVRLPVFKSQHNL